MLHYNIFLNEKQKAPPKTPLLILLLLLGKIVKLVWQLAKEVADHPTSNLFFFF
jgi:hypothetical protein